MNKPKDSFVKSSAQDSPFLLEIRAQKAGSATVLPPPLPSLDLNRARTVVPPPPRTRANVQFPSAGNPSLPAPRSPSRKDSDCRIDLGAIMRVEHPVPSEFLDFLPVDEFELQEKNVLSAPAYSSIAPVTDSILPPSYEVPPLSRLKVSLILGAVCFLAFSGGLLASQPRTGETIAHASMQPLVAPITLRTSTDAISLSNDQPLELPSVAITAAPPGKADLKGSEKQAEARGKKSDRQKETSKSKSEGNSAEIVAESAAADSEPEFAPALPAFDPASASSALSALVDAARGCLHAGDPSSNIRVSVTFAASGRATVAVIDGPPYAGTAVGGCIARAFRAARVAPFDGSPTTVHKSFSVP